jgi:glycosyltransferase involved in cell wall biosynthesis
MAKISIIMATYNRSHTILRAIVSVIAQSLKDWELWIIDDGSKDNTKDVINSFLEKYKSQNPQENLPVYYQYQENTGQALALNNGIERANGDFITFLDSDDEYLAEHLALRLRFFEDNPNVNLIHGGLEIIGNPFVPDKFDISKMIHIDDCVAGGTIFGKSYILKKLLFKKMAYSSDSNVIDRAIEAGFCVEKVIAPFSFPNRSNCIGNVPTNADKLTKLGKTLKSECEIRPNPHPFVGRQKSQVIAIRWRTA